jgi:hypothetical protein
LIYQLPLSFFIKFLPVLKGLLTAGLAQAKTPHPRGGPWRGGGESAWHFTAAKGGDGATAGDAP